MNSYETMVASYLSNKAFLCMQYFFLRFSDIISALVYAIYVEDQVSNKLATSVLDRVDLMTNKRTTLKIKLL